MQNTNIINAEYVCERCGKVHDADELVEVIVDKDGTTELWCEDCAALDAGECEHCGRLVANDFRDDVVTGIGETQSWCPCCIDDDASTCPHCGSVTANGAFECVVTRNSWNRTYRRYEDWCPDCVDDDAHRCNECEELFADSVIDEITLYNGDTIHVCDVCRDVNYRQCYDCCDWFNVDWDDYYYDEDDDEYYCDNCADHHRRSPSINHYHHTSGCTFWGDDGSHKSDYALTKEDQRTLYLGMELEIDDVDDLNGCADTIMSSSPTGWSIQDQIELKEDCSLNDGMEIVSQPMTPKFHLTSGLWEGIIDTCRDFGARSYDAHTCGLHIHISRSFFVNHDAVYRLDRLFHRYRNEFVRFSRRGDDLHWCRISDDSDLDLIDDTVKRKETWERKKWHADRYEAVNDTNEATVEIRLWRGSLNLETVRATIEMTAGLAIVANTMSDELAEKLTWNQLKVLVRYALEAEGLPHDDLDAYLIRRGL